MKNIRNKVQLIGNVGNTPKLEETKNGKKYVKLSIATNNTYTNKEGEKIKDTQWHPVMFWGKKLKSQINIYLKVKKSMLKDH